MIKNHKRIISRILLMELLMTTFIPVMKAKAVDYYGVNDFTSITANSSIL